MVTTRDCKICEGKCWAEGNNFETQHRAMEMFGYIPNQCVTLSTGQSECPYSYYYIRHTGVVEDIKSGMPSSMAMEKAEDTISRLHSSKS